MNSPFGYRPIWVTMDKVRMAMLQHLSWRCVEYAIHHERDVREEKHP